MHYRPVVYLLNNFINLYIARMPYYIGVVETPQTGALAAPGLKRLKPTKKTPKKHLENPPKMPTSQGRHTLNDGGSHSRATARTTPSNSPL